MIFSILFFISFVSIYPIKIPPSKETNAPLSKITNEKQHAVKVTNKRIAQAKSIFLRIFLLCGFKNVMATVKAAPIDTYLQ